MLIRAEILKLRRQRAALFWGFLFVPLIMLFFSFALGGGLLRPPEGVLVNEVRLARSLTRALSIGGNPIAQLFYAIGGAAIFAVEYRYSGWRHIVPRAPRERLILAKFASFALFTAISLTLAGTGDAIVALSVPLLHGQTPMVTDMTAVSFSGVVFAALISFAQLLTLGAIVTLLVILTRSGMGAIIAAFLLALGTAAAGAYLGEATNSIPLPGFASDALRLWLAKGNPGPLIPGLTLAAWIVAPLAAAIALFARQDLVSE